jgi:hypothetical protein
MDLIILNTTVCTGNKNYGKHYRCFNRTAGKRRQRFCKDKLIGTTTDNKGNYTLSVSKIKFPFTLVFSSISHEEKQVQVNGANETISISLAPRTVLLNEVVTAASRVPESILRSPVSIEKMNLKAIQESPCTNLL